MTDAMLVVALRGGERLLVVMVAALCIWLGYRLFQAMPTVHRSDGRLELPGAKLILSKVGPGVFFAVFGAGVLTQSVLTQVRISGGDGGDPAISYVAPAAADPQSLRYAEADIGILNCLAAVPPRGLGDGHVEPGEIEAALHRARVALMARVWQPAWGAAAMAALTRGEVPADGPVAGLYRARHPACPPIAGAGP
ncbi:MAG TPA: hypothetical protein VGM87_17300 [Roseomonas sp.]|jgi:hypothetical protein